MERKYICPKCDGHLKVGEYIVFAVKSQEKKRGLILLHPEVGNYTSIKHPEFVYDPGEGLDFFCPMCQKNLSSDIDKNLIHVILIENDIEYKIYFSRIAGEKSTYKVYGDEVSSTGEHADKYTYFKLADKFKKYL